MPYCNIIGKIVFTEKLEKDDAIELSYYLTQKAIDNRIGINLYCNLTSDGELFFPIKNYLREGYIPYEILDNPLTNECSHMFRKIMYGANRIAYVAKSGVTRLQHFYEEILEHKWISYITVRFYEKHSSDTDLRAKTEVYNKEIKVSELCTEIENTPLDEDYTGFPDVRLKIVK